MTLERRARNVGSLYSHKNAHVDELSKGNCKQKPDPSTSLSRRKGTDSLGISRIWKHDVFQGTELRKIDVSRDCEYIIFTYQEETVRRKAI